MNSYTTQELQNFQRQDPDLGPGARFTKTAS